MIYPVPASDWLFAKGEQLEKIKAATILDYSGRVVLKESQPFDRKNNISISHLKSGNYILQLDGKGFKFIKK